MRLRLNVSERGVGAPIPHALSLACNAFFVRTKRPASTVFFGSELNHSSRSFRDGMKRSVDRTATRATREVLEARCFTAKPEIGRRDSSPRVCSARSVAIEGATVVHAALVVVSMTPTRGVSGRVRAKAQFPAVRNRTLLLQPDTRRFL